MLYLHCFLTLVKLLFIKFLRIIRYFFRLKNSNNDDDDDNAQPSRVVKIKSRFSHFVTANAAAASYMNPYAYATLQGAAGLPGSTAGAAFPTLQYQTTPQEARLQ